MERLVDYFAVVGYDFDGTDKEDLLRGKVVSRIPETDWKDQPFTSGIELFCQPGGWYLSKEKQPVTFFVSVLTNETARQQYCAVLSFSEPLRNHSPTHANRTLTKGRNKSVDCENNVSIVENGIDCSHGEDVDDDMCRVEDEDTGYIFEPSDPVDTKKDFKYAPKCLVLLSRVQDFKVLKNSLGIVYSIYIDNHSHSIENIIAKLLLVQVPPPGSSQLKFKIGPTDQQILQTPRSLQLPITRSCVSMLLRQLGILNVLNILCAALIDQKLLFYSCSYVRLTEACNALTALMYPFKYSYTYIPILPRHLLEFTSSPTPFLVGVHSSCKSDMNDLLDVVTVDLDGGVISVPECVNLPAIPDPYCRSVVEALTKVLCPDLMVADWAYPPDHVTSSEPEKLDKEIRAIFLRLFCQLLMGYRTCLQVCRIHPKPILRFQKEQYLTMRGFDVTTTSSSNEFIPKLINSQAFSIFVQDNGPPFRCLHKFDLVVAQTAEQIQTDDVYEALKHIRELANDLYVNENPNRLPFSERIPKPSENAYLRTTQRRFPKLSATAVQAFMEENKATSERERSFKPTKPVRKRVPEESKSVSQITGGIGTSARRLEVLKNCLSFIFESKTLEIKKIFQAVIRAMKSLAVRHAMALELVPYSKQHALLDNQQFEYVARLLNSALQDSSGQLDEYTLAADLLPLVTSFHRKLSSTVTQFMYLEVQDHPVWSSSVFWENAFFDDIQDEIQHLYRDSLQSEKLAARLKSPRRRTGSPTHISPSHTGTDFSTHSSKQHSSLQRYRRSRRDNRLCMEIAAIQLEEWSEKSPDEQRDISSAEESVVFSQAMHMAQKMVFMLVPLDSTKVNRARFLRYAAAEENSSNSFVTNSVTGSLSGSIDGEQMYGDATENASDVSANVSKFISRFVDRVCTETSIGNAHTNSLLNNIPTLVAMQVESLEDVCRESRRLPPIKKPKLLQPQLLPGEVAMLRKPLRTFLAFDGRATATGGVIGGPALLPAEGAMFLTTYRVIFIGTPCDALAAEQVVIRSFPVSSLFKIKSFKVHDFPHIAKIDKNVQDGIQLRSSTFQLLLLAFDDEVEPEEKELLEKQIHELRYPSTIEGAFAISSIKAVDQSAKGHVRRNTGSSVDTTAQTNSKMSAAKTIYKQAKRKAGLDKPNRISKLIGPDAKSRTLYPSNMGSSGSTSTLGRMPAIDEAMTKTLSDKDTMNRLIQRSCEADYKRMGFVGIAGAKFRMSRVNRLFSVCRSYPVCVMVPMTVTDEQIKSLAHCHDQSRFPAAVWMHPRTKAILLRSSAIKSRTANSLFKHNQQRLSDEGTLGSSSEEEKFLLKIASLSTHQNRSGSAIFRLDSANSLSSIDDESGVVPSPTLSLSGVSSLSGSVRSLRGAKKWNSLNRTNGKAILDQANYSPKINTRSTSAGLPANGTITQAALADAITRKAQLYIFGDKNQVKNLRHEHRGKVMFVPLELAEPKQIRTSFKSFIKSCLPADPPITCSYSQKQQAEKISEETSECVQDALSSYLKEVQDSVWLDQVSMLIQAAGSIVDVIDIHGASVMISINDGSDVVPQISSLAQILLDPYYRTLEGFRVLIEKEWLSFGHRFSHRNRFNDIESSGFTPIFLMFLDTVYQLHQQFPMSFEFNDIYLEVIAYHAMSNRFTTFLLDSDFERLEAGILFEKKVKKRSSFNSSSSDHNPSTSAKSQIRSFWDYIDLAHERSPVFFNPLYCPFLPSQVLRPVSSLCRLKVWPYYFREALGEGPPYDGLLGELTTGTSHNEQEATETSEAWGGATGRRLVNRCYDNIADAQPDSIKMLLNKIEGLQGELGLPIDSWTTTWKSIGSASCEIRILPDSIIQNREEVRSLHKVTTADVIHKKLEYTQSNFYVPIRMRTMSTVIASSLVPRAVHSSSKRAAREQSLTSEYSTYASDSDVSSVHEHSQAPAIIPFQTSSMEVRTFEGNLWKKQSALLKNWKLRFFVLDTTKHELRQYDSRAELSTKNIIDLKDLESVQRIDSVTNPPNGAARNSYFEVKIAKRTYTFIAESENAARVWVDKLQAALQ